MMVVSVVVLLSAAQAVIAGWDMAGYKNGLH